MNPLAIPLPIAVRRHGEIVGIIFGIVCLPFALYAGALSGIFPNGPTAVVLPIVMLSALAGAIASATVDASNAPNIGGVPLRIGARAGIVASLVAGGCSVLASTFHSFGIGSPPSAGFGWDFLHVIFPASPSIALALLSIPPSIFFGLTGALLAEMMKGGAVESDGRAPSPATARIEKSATFRFALLLTLGCYLSPLLVTLKPAPKPAPVAAVAPQPTTVPTLTPKPPAPPPWHYQKPEGFDTAEAGRIAVVEQRNLPEIAKGMPVAMSPDGLRFACCRAGTRTQVEITDLESLDVIAIAQLPETPAVFAWSPDSKMLLITSEGSERSLMVLDVAKARILSLPLPRGARLPEGRPIWWDTQEVIFARGEKVSSILNLESLRVAPADGSPKWKALGDAQRLDFLHEAVAHLSRNDRWEMQFGTALRSYSIPPNASEKWQWAFSLQVVVVDRKKAHRFLLPSVRTDTGDAFTASRDGTKLVRIHDEQATVFFLGLRQETPARFKISMPEAPEVSVADALAKKNVAAFVCAPVINPLNGRTVAPNRSVVKAIVRVAKWQDKTAEFWTDENYLPLQPGDVIADLHTWEANQPHSAGQLGKDEWFAVIESLDSGSTPPLRADATDLERGPSLVIDNSGGADRVEKTVATTTREPQPTPRPVAPAPPVPPVPAVTATRPEPPPIVVPKQEPKPLPPRETPESVVRNFMAAHTEKANRYDAKGYVSDFSDPVDYYTRGMESRASILTDVLNAQAEYRMTESIKSIAITQLSPTRFEARCTITHINVQNGSGKQTGGTSTTNYTVELTSAGPKITRIRLAK